MLIDTSRILRRLTALAALVPLLALAACGDGDDGPYVEIVGGGFVFNYRIAEVFYGVTVVAHRPLPPGAELTAAFEDPAGGPPIRVSRQARDHQTRFSLESGPLQGVVADHDYTVVVTLSVPSGEVLETHTRVIRSKLDQSVLPPRPLTVGPGYTPNPDNAPARGE